MTLREFIASGEKGDFAQQLLRTFVDPCAGNLRLLRAVADGRNRRLVDESRVWARRQCRFTIDPTWDCLREALADRFPILLELDREVTGADHSRLPRDAAKEANK